MSELAVVCGAGGFIGGHLVRSLIDRGYRVRAVDIKAHPKEWWQVHEDAENKFAMDLRTFDACLKSLDGATRVYNLASDMGGMGFIENNKAGCAEGCQRSKFRQHEDQGVVELGAVNAAACWS